MKYLTKTGEPAADAKRQAREEAASLAKGNYVPHVIEPSAGVDRLALALISNAYCEDQAPDEKGNMESRVVMRFHPRIAPVKVAVFPLLKNKPELVAKALEVRDLLRPHSRCFMMKLAPLGAVTAARTKRARLSALPLISTPWGSKAPDSRTPSPCANVTP